MSVTVTDTKNSSGEIDFNLFNKADGFPDDATKAFKHVRGKISNGKCSVTFQNLPFGEYAIIIYHDANSNNKCDETWYGMPKEGVGISNNPSLGAFRPPSFEKGKFSLNKTEQTTSISIIYL